MKIEVGQIWVVVDDFFLASLRVDGMNKVGRFHLLEGEKFEIRFPFEWNYRSEDNNYFYSDPQYILDRCKIFGMIREEIRFDNQASLEEILRLRLYDPY